jgi:hypothetical protein
MEYDLPLPSPPYGHPSSPLLSLPQVTYDNRCDEFPSYNFPTTRQMGWIADDVADLIPEIVMTDAEGYRHVSYSRSVAILGEAIKELSNDWKKRQEEYEAKLQQQQKEIDELKELVMKLISNRSP